MFEKQAGGKKLEDQLEKIFKSMFECVTSPTNLKKYVSGTPEKPKLSRRKLNQVILSCFNAKKKQFDGMVKNIAVRSIETKKSLNAVNLVKYIRECAPENISDEEIEKVARTLAAAKKRKKKG